MSIATKKSIYLFSLTFLGVTRVNTITFQGKKMEIWIHFYQNCPRLWLCWYLHVYWLRYFISFSFFFFEFWILVSFYWLRGSVVKWFESGNVMGVGLGSTFRSSLAIVVRIWISLIRSECSSESFWPAKAFPSHSSWLQFNWIQLASTEEEIYVEWRMIPSPVHSCFMLSF